MLELQCYLASIIDFMQRNVKEVENLISAPNYKIVDDMEDLVTVLHGHFNTMKKVKSSWEFSLQASKEILKDSFVLFS